MAKCELKSKSKAIDLRAEGNQLYSVRSFYEALLKYNQSLCYAEPGSEDLGHGYANRSAIYFEMKLFDKSLENIELARTHNYPSEKFELLSLREQKCRALLKGKEKKPELFFKLSHAANKKFPFVIESLEQKIDAKYGRYIVTNKALRVGDIIAIEKPFCSVLLAESAFVTVPESNLYQRCSNCLGDNALDLIPCASCCQAMFCSTECRDVALKRFHRFECPVMSQLTKRGSVHMTLRIFFIALSAFEDSIEEFEIFVKQNDSTIFDVDEGDKGRLLALLSAARSSTIFSLAQHEQILKSHPELSKPWETHREFISGFLQQLTQISDHNFHGIFSGSSKREDAFNPKNAFSNLQQPIGSGSMLFCSLINHSCSNNVMRICFEGKVMIVVIRPIQKGSQLFDCYNASFVKYKKFDRQAKLHKEFGFICDCEACSKDFPTPPALGIKDKKLLGFAKKTEDEIMTLQLKQAYRRFRDCCELLEKHHNNFPSVELFMLQKSIATFLLRQALPSVLFP